MTDTTSTAVQRGENIVDRAAQAADKAIEASRRAASSAIDNVSDKVHQMREQAAPVLERMASPVESITKYTQDAPLKSLLVAATVGAGLMAVISLLTRSNR